MTITCVSVIVAMAIGGIEALGILAGHFHRKGRFWDKFWGSTITSARLAISS